jgi:plastocyanin
VIADASGSTDADSTPIAGYSFDFGDGSAAVGPQDAASAAHTYTQPGTYTVKVTVKDTAGSASTATGIVRVASTSGEVPPAAALTVTPAAGTVPLAVTADASGSTDPDDTPIATYSFDFGDGSPAVGPQPGATAAHTYTDAGTYTVTVTVTDTSGLTGTATARVDAAASTNLVGNPGFELNTSGWNTSSSGPGVTLARVAGGHTGGWAAKLTNTSSGAATCNLNDSPNWVANTTAGATYTATIWVRSDFAGATIKAKLREYSGTTAVGSASTLLTLTTGWQPLTVTYRATSSGSSIDLNVYVTDAAPGTCFYADDASITAS